MNRLGIFFIFISIFASATTALSNNVRIQQKSGSTTTSTAKQWIPTKAISEKAGATITETELTLPIIPDSLFVNGTFEPLFGNGFAFPINVTIKKISESSVQLRLHCVNTATYSVSYSSVDGWVLKTAQLEKSNKPGPPREIQIEERLQKIFENLQRINFGARSLELISKGGDSRVAFEAPDGDTTPTVSAARSVPTQRPITADDNVHANVSKGGHQIGAVEPRELGAVGIRYVVPDTYLQNGRFQPLFSGRSFPITIHTERRYGTTLKVTLKAINTITYELTYNNADGWVSDCVPKDQTQYTGTPDQMDAEAKIKNIIANTQQIAFEKDGRIQFITDHGSTRISFDPAFPAPRAFRPQPPVYIN